MTETGAILPSDWLQVCELWSRFAAEIRARAQLSEAQVAAVCGALEDWADPRVPVTPPGPGVKLGGWVRWCQVELETEVHKKVRNHGEGPC